MDSDVDVVDYELLAIGFNFFCRVDNMHYKVLYFGQI